MIYICGPTSSGKTSLAIKLCKKYNGEIVSADSRQIYKKMDIGTGKLPITSKYEISKNDNCWIIGGVKIWMYDVTDPLEYYSVADYKNEAKTAISDILSRGKIPFVVGGTGLYINALLGNIDAKKSDEPNWELRNELQNLSVTDLQKRLPQEILSGMNNSDINNPRRLIRKIEKLSQTGITQDRTKSGFSENKNSYKSVIILSAKRETLYSRVDHWVDEIWKLLVSETEELIRNGYANSEVMKGLIYKTSVDLLNGNIDERSAIERVKFDLHSYIRRQETYFNKFIGAKVIDIEDPNFDTEANRLVELIYNEQKSCR